MAPNKVPRKSKQANKRVVENQAFLRLLHNTSAKQRKSLIKTANRAQILSVCECAFNILKRNIPLSPQQISQLRKARNIVYKIADKKVPLPKKQKLLEQSGGFLPALIAPIIGTILGAVAERVINR